MSYWSNELGEQSPFPFSVSFSHIRVSLDCLSYPGSVPGPLPAPPRVLLVGVQDMHLDPITLDSALPSANPADTFSSDIWPPELRENKFPLG